MDKILTKAEYFKTNYQRGTNKVDLTSKGLDTRELKVKSQ